MNRSGDFARIMSMLVLIASGWIVGLAAPVHCQESQRVEPGAKTRLTTPTWVPTGNLNTARSDHTATLLPNGKVLVVGGRANDILNSAELYDPTIGTWSIANAMSTPRVFHTATLLPDGRILVAGGDTTQGYATPNFGRTNTAELYDPGTGTWSATGNMTAIRSEHTATLLQNGKVLVAGGFYSDTLDTAELYDPVTGSWSPTGKLNVARYGHTATRLQNGKVLVARGSNDGDLASSLFSAESYDPIAGTWAAVANLSESSVFHTATLLQNGNVLVAGGYTGGVGGGLTLAKAELFDPASGTWSGTSSLVAARYSHTATLLASGEVLVAGGHSETGHYPSIRYDSLDDAETFDPGATLWSRNSVLHVARFGHTATLLPDGTVLVAGGSVDGPSYTTSVLSSAELYATALLPGIIGPGFTGSWYDPAQSGHGLFIEVLPESRFYVSWFAFNPAGTQQAWFTGVGTYRGNTASITAVEQPTGGRWIPNFDPNQVIRNAWGTLTFTFTDCDHGKVDFNSVAGYGTGSMNLMRLTQPAGLTCP